MTLRDVAFILLGLATAFAARVAAHAVERRRALREEDRPTPIDWTVRHVDSEPLAVVNGEWTLANSEALELVETLKRNPLPETSLTIGVGEDPEIEVRHVASVTVYESDDCKELEGRVRWESLGRA